MSHVAQVKLEKLSIGIHSTYGAIALVGINTFALLAFERLGLIPTWVKGVAAIFLAL